MDFNVSVARTKHLCLPPIKELQEEEEEEEKLEEVEENLISLVQKCPNMRVLRQIHAHVLTHALPSSSLSFLLSKIVGFCALSPLGDIDHARRVFHQIRNPNIFCWNSMIRGCSLVETPSKEPFFFYRKLIKRCYPNPNSFTLAFVLKACAIVSSLNEGLQIHSHALRTGLGSSQFVQTALVNLYSKCEDIGSARRLFDEIPERNLIAWSTMISGYARTGLVNEALSLFRGMQKVEISPDEVTLVSVVSACATSGALDLGEWVHAFIDKHFINVDLELGTALVNMYAKCGCIERARKLFDEMPIKDTKAWSSMIMGLAIHGLAEDALNVFSRMEETKVKTNHVTFIGVLSACAHSGLVTEGQRYWSTMLESGIEPSMEHYGCMVDLLCRAGLIEDAYTFVQTMPIPPNAVIWRTLIVGCKKTGILDRGEIIAERLLELEPLNGENYILISNMLASRSQWEKVSHMRKKMKDIGVKPIPGCGSIEVDGFVHEFVIGDGSHPEIKEINNILRDISEQVRYAGHEAWTSAVLHDVNEDEKESALFEHSERLAVAFGLLKTKAPAVIRVVKNLRFCDDCHEVTKIISKLYKREIIVRDRVRFHKFIDGTCSCRDYW
ncbi:pentatricopeptide repeat-containing protein At2g02980, chloroplastic-like [Macadamia integrifolia]|uniref:pentatricopeptide repeat-containing protein At2g02980, chloroplastic-like n=1 Tax=Macadamia integrifolia TaxID=60698 RepID=UPI001C52D075|nr:pentatricopeptide repeat-containing protein At2g02980, chloroplastic-like [Macadamia integrifolia]